DDPCRADDVVVDGDDLHFEILDFESLVHPDPRDWSLDRLQLPRLRHRPVERPTGLTHVYGNLGRYEGQQCHVVVVQVTDIDGHTTGTRGADEWKVCGERRIEHRRVGRAVAVSGIEEALETGRHTGAKVVGQDRIGARPNEVVEQGPTGRDVWVANDSQVEDEAAPLAGSEHLDSSDRVHPVPEGELHRPLPLDIRA